MENSDFFKNNRQQLLKRIGKDIEGVIVITAQALLQRSADTTYPFRQESNFLYLTGLNMPELVLVKSLKEEFIILPKRSEVEDIFGGTVNCDEIAKKSGIQKILGFTEGWKYYKEFFSSYQTVYTLMPAPVKISSVDSFYTNPARKFLLSRLKRVHKSSSFKDLRSELANMRQRKQPEEIAAIKQAIQVTKKGFEAAKTLVTQCKYEHEVEASFDYIFKTHKASHGYAPPIIAAGKNACALHYCNGTDVLGSGDFVMLDVGAEINGYTADISRTYAVSKVSKRQQNVYDCVARVHKKAIALLKDGLEWRSYIVQVDSIMAEELMGLGLISNNSRSEVRRYFPHSISHSLGLDVHDVCDYRVIQKDMVITVEPGIYIPEEGIGVRIEDDILITQNGTINLSADIPY